MTTIRVYFEEGRTSVFAVALDWPGWCRRSTSLDLALESLLDYQERYARIVGDPFNPGRVEVIGSVAGTATTDFGAPSVSGPWDQKPLSQSQRARQVAILESCWQRFDDIASSAPATLRKGPRGGGRDRDKIVDHVREAERIYCPKVGLRVAPRTPWDAQRRALSTTLLTGPPGATWTTRYAISRIAWHVVDHAWEIEDKST